jgi:Ni/Co efflux regulator RcnB
MCDFRWGLSMLLILSLLAFSSSSWAQGKQSQQMDRETWGDQGDKRHGGQPPGWDKGNKTGWRGDNQPPGQKKKYRKRQHRKSKHDRQQGDYRKPPTPPGGGQQQGDYRQPQTPPGVGQQQ